MNKNFQPWLVIAALVFLMASITIGLLVIQKSNTLNNSSMTAPVATNSENSTASETSEWKTYVSDMHHYTIRVPYNWQIYDKPPVFIGLPGEVAFGLNLEESFNSALYVTVSGEALDGNKFPRYDLDTEEEYRQWLAAPVSTGSEGEAEYKIGNVTVAGVPAVQYISRPGKEAIMQGTEAFNAIVTWFRYNDQNYNIEFTFPSDESVKLYNQILSSVVLGSDPS